MFLKNLGMLNLRELSEKLNSALEQETEETLTSWLLGQRIGQIEDYIGYGEYIAISGTIHETIVTKNTPAPAECEFVSISIPGTEYSFAA